MPKKKGGLRNLREFLFRTKLMETQNFFVPTIMVFANVPQEYLSIPQCNANTPVLTNYLNMTYYDNELPMYVMC